MLKPLVAATGAAGAGTMVSATGADVFLVEAAVVMLSG
jgi:hypothetical protein